MMKLESDKHAVCEGNCKECVRCLRLYLCDAEDCGGMSVWRTWFDSRLALSNSSSSALSHSSSNVGRFAGQYPWRRVRSSTESMRLLSGACTYCVLISLFFSFLSFLSVLVYDIHIK